MATILEEISKIVERLPLDRQQKVLEFVQKLTWAVAPLEGQHHCSYSFISAMAGETSGSEKEIVVPCKLLCAQMVPPWASMKALQMVTPKPPSSTTITKSR